MDWKLTLTTFGAVFIAELGDKTQLATLAFTTSGGSRWAVFIGSAGALVATSAIAVLAGEAVRVPVAARGALHVGVAVVEEADLIGDLPHAARPRAGAGSRARSAGAAGGVAGGAGRSQERGGEERGRGGESEVGARHEDHDRISTRRLGARVRANFLSRAGSS